MNVLTSFGNMGFAKPICGKDIVEWGDQASQTINFQCERSTEIKAVFDVGIQISEKLPFGSDNTLASCSSEDLTPGTASHEYTFNYLKRDALKSDFMAHCQNESSCAFTFNA